MGFLFIVTSVALAAWWLGPLTFVAMLHWWSAYPTLIGAIVLLMLVEYKQDLRALNRYRTSQKEAGSPESIQKYVTLVRPKTGAKAGENEK